MSKMLRMTEESLKQRIDMIKAKRIKPERKPVLQVAKLDKKGKVGKFKPIIPTEHQEQTAVIQWCDQHPIAKLIFAIPNGANKSPATAAKFKREGLRKGVADLFLPVARSGFYGLFIEMKRRKGSVTSPEQVTFAAQVHKQGYCYFVCYGAENAIGVIARYLEE